MSTASTSVSAKTQHLPALDGIRALAIVLVVVYHVFDMQLGGERSSVVRQLVGFGWVGVPLFFVLSGFLVGGRLFAQLRDGTFRAGRFYADRSFRILPVAFVYLVFYGLRRGLLGWNVWTLANFTYVSERFGIQAPRHYWSLQIEEQFYSLAPLLLAGLVGFLRRGDGDITARFQRIVAYAIPAAWAFRALSAFYPHAAGYDVYRDGCNYLEFFFVGVLVHTVVHGVHAAKIRAALEAWTARRQVPAHAPLALALCAYGPLSLTQAWGYNTVVGTQDWGQILVYPFLAAWAGAVVLLAALADPPTNALARVLASRPAHVLAVLSYSAYIWHTDVLIGFHFAELPLWAQLVVDALVIGITTVLSYYLFEVPFLFLRDLTRNGSALRRFAVLSVRRAAAPGTGAEVATRTKGSFPGVSLSRDTLAA